MRRSFITLLVTLTLAALVLVGVGYTFGEVVMPGEVGVRQGKIAPFQGFSERGLPPGYHWSVPFFSEIHKVPTTLQVMHLQPRAANEPTGYGQLEVQTTDGTKVLLDLTVIFRFYAEPLISDSGEMIHSGPRDLITKLGISRERWDSRIYQVVENELRQSLGSLSSSQFYNPTAREEGLAVAQRKINNALRKDFGVEVEGLLLRRYTYAEARIDNAIFQKNLQTQEGKLNAAASRLAEARAKTEDLAAEMDATIRTRLVEGESKVGVLRSEGDLYETKKKAEGDLLVAKATAEVDRLKAQALSGAEGAETYVARELAVLLSSLKGGVVTGVEPFNLESWVKLLGAPEASGSGGAAAPQTGLQEKRP